MHARPPARLAIAVAAAALGAALLSPVAAAAAAPAVPATPVPLHFSPGPFTDVLPGYWAGAAIAGLAKAGLALAPAPHLFNPLGAETRGAWVEQVYLAVRGQAPSAPAAAPFADVPATLPAAPEIAAAKALGWIPFPVGADFGPDQAITREQAFSILARAFLGAAAAGAALPFTDAAQTSAWARAPMAALYSAGLIAGVGGGRILPRAPLTRADAAALLDTVLRHVVTAGGHRYRVLQFLRLRATAYGDGEPGMGSQTATGTPVHVGEAAADPHYLPYGTLLWVSGYDAHGYLPPAGLLETIQDTGRLGPGQIDLYMAAPDEWPYQLFGVQMVTGYVLDPVPLT